MMGSGRDKITGMVIFILLRRLYLEVRMSGSAVKLYMHVTTSR